METISMKKYHKTPLKVVCVSDMHCGSDVGLRPPEVELPNGNVNYIGNSIHQQFLWDSWLKAIEWVKTVVCDDPFILLINGDAIEGIHHGSTELVAMEWETHLAIAYHTLKPLTDLTDNILMVKGTECHTQNLENELACAIGAREGKAKNQWLFRVNGVLNDAQHHMGTTKRKWLESGEGCRIMANNRLNCLDAGHEPPRVFWRAHRHVGGYIEQSGNHFLVAGAWQFLTRYGHKVVGDSIPVPTVQFMDFTDPDFLVHKECRFYIDQPNIFQF